MRLLLLLVRAMLALIVDLLFWSLNKTMNKTWNFAHPYSFLLQTQIIFKAGFEITEPILLFYRREESGPESRTNSPEIILGSFT